MMVRLVVNSPRPVGYLITIPEAELSIALITADLNSNIAS